MGISTLRAQHGKIVRWSNAKKDLLLLRGTLVNRTYGIHKNLYI